MLDVLCHASPPRIVSVRRWPILYAWHLLGWQQHVDGRPVSFSILSCLFRSREQFRHSRYLLGLPQYADGGTVAFSTLCSPQYADGASVAFGVLQRLGQRPPSGLRQHEGSDGPDHVQGSEHSKRVGWMVSGLGTQSQRGAFVTSINTHANMLPLFCLKVLQNGRNQTKRSSPKKKRN